MRNSIKSYARGCLKFYLLNHSGNLHDWEAADTIIQSLPDKDIEILEEVFTRKDTLADNIYETAHVRGIDQGMIWKLLNDVSKAIAKERGLL